MDNKEKRTEQINEILRLKSEGLTVSDISKKMGISITKIKLRIVEYDENK